ncbi:MAG: hypothetical protein FJW96_02105, partial [Actinobacteria bacterium]|nr:hypothetical protein [Actinomycetota bacterium]
MATAAGAPAGTTAPGARPTAGAVVVNEYNARNVGSGRDFFELLVTGDGLDLRGLRISDNELVDGALNGGESVFVLGQESFLEDVPAGTLIAVWTDATGVTPDTRIDPAAGDRSLVLAPGTGVETGRDGLADPVATGLQTAGDALYVYLPGADGTSAGTDNVYLDFVSWEDDRADPPPGLSDLNLPDPA